MSYGERVRAQLCPTIPAGQLLGKWYVWDGTKWATTNVSYSTQSSSYLGSIRYCKDLVNPGPPYLTGGPFTSLNCSLNPWSEDTNPISVTSQPDFIFTAPFNNRYGQYIGRFGQPDFSGADTYEPYYGNMSQLLIQPGVFPSTSSYRALVSKRLRPHLEKASLAVAIAEFRDNFVTLRNTAKYFHDVWKGLGGDKHNPLMAPKRVSDDFLSVQFGWMPFVGDVTDACRVLLFAQDYIAELTRKNNTWDHREATVEETESDVLISSGSGCRVQPNNSTMDNLYSTGSGSRYTYEFRRVVKQRVWGSGDYKFYRPEFDDSLATYNSNFNKLQQYLIIGGIRLNPSVLYKITPWTWLLDWFTNTGDVIDELTAAAADGLVSKNLFLMCQRYEDIVLNQHLNFKNGPKTLTFRRMIRSKQREHGETPFGFGLLPSDLSWKQWSILGALGITKFL